MNDQSRNNLDNETDIAVKGIQSRASRKDPRVALDTIVTILQNSPNYFNWVNAGVEMEVPQWLLRIAKQEGEMKNEEVAVIHVCRPIGMWEAVEQNDPEKTVAHSGYVEKGECVRCHTSQPEELDATFGTAMKILKLGKAIS